MSTLPNYHYGAQVGSFHCRSREHAHSCPYAPESIIADEPAWRVPRQSSATASSASKVIATRWRAGSERTLEFGAETAADCHVVKIVLRTMNIRFSVSGRTVQNVSPHLGRPRNRACLTRSLPLSRPYDVLHLHVPNALIAECARDMPGQQAPILRSEAVPSKDIVIDWLGRALLEANRLDGSFGQTYADCISMAIIARAPGFSEWRGHSERLRQSSKLHRGG